MKTGHTTYKIPLIVLVFLFFLWGFVTCMNDVLIPYLKELFALNYFQAMLVQFCFFGAYFIGSLIYYLVSRSGADPINKIGYKNGIIMGLIISAVACFLFYPAAKLSIYTLFLGALFILGLGFTMLQITANPYVSLLGRRDGAPSRLNLAQGLNSLGTTVAPILGGYLIFELYVAKGGSGSVEWIYIFFTLLFLFLALVVYYTDLPEFKNKEIFPKGFDALHFPHLKWGILAMFLYVGAEVAIGSFIISFLALPEILGIAEKIAKNYLALYWGGAMIGRFVGAVSLNKAFSITKRYVFAWAIALTVFVLLWAIVPLSFEQIYYLLFFVVLNLIGSFIGKSSPSKTLGIFAFINVLLLFLLVFSTGKLTFWLVIGMGLFNSIMWSNIFTLSIEGLGKYTVQGSSLLIMAILGGALVPLGQGVFADIFGIQNSFLLLMPCYLYIAFFGFFYHRISTKNQ